MYEYILIIITFFILVVAFLMLNRKKVLLSKAQLEEELKLQTKDLEEKKEFLDLVFNSLPFIAVISDGERILNVNKKVIDFFGFKDSKELLENHKCLCEFFIQKDGFIQKDINGTNWIDYIYKNPGDYKALIEKDNKNHIFNIEIKRFKQNRQKIYLVVLSDVTNREKQLSRIKYRMEHDNMTGIFNRLKFDEVLAFEIDSVNRTKIPLSIAILDLDHFKRVNDTYGHLIGDEVLVMITKYIESHKRKTDIFARWGGEEFVLLLINTNLKNAETFLNNLREDIAKLSHKKAGSVTCSFGLTQFKEKDTAKDILKRCDDALYEAKNTGRNKVSVLA